MRDRPRHAGTPSTEPLRYDKSQLGTALIYRCRGAFSLANHNQLGMLAEEIRRNDAPHTVLDLREVAYMDSVGVGTVAVTLKDMRASSRKLSLVPTPEIRLLLTASKLEGILTLADTPEAAVGS